MHVHMHGVINHIHTVHGFNGPEHVGTVFVPNRAGLHRDMHVVASYSVDRPSECFSVTSVASRIDTTPFRLHDDEQLIVDKVS